MLLFTGLSVNARQEYIPDILGKGFERQTILQPDDYEGKVICTLIRKQSMLKTGKAVLYVHGFNDYFFQTEMGQWFNDQGFDFYAVDLRKYGRSWMPHQKLNDARDMKEYFADLDSALQIIADEGHNDVLLSGHSTGGLIVTYYVQEHPQATLYDGIFLNSPFFEFNEPWLLRRFGVPFIAKQGTKKPAKIKKGGFTKWYGYSLHDSEQGEWSYDLTWKPHVAPYVNYGWIRAIYHAQQAVRSGKKIPVPVLVIHSMHSVYPKKWSERVFTGDAILNVKHIREVSQQLNAGNKTVIAIDGLLHDVVLSKKEFRDQAYTELKKWLNENYEPA